MPRRGHGDLEQEILTALDPSDGPMTAGQVRERLGDALAYNTITTVLGRLHRKGRVTRSPVGRGYRYEIVRDPAQVTAFQMRRLLDGDTDRGAVLTRFVGSLSPEDEDLLTRLLRSTDQE
nr:BlaI/MecI/CopY family transcriptional regulator [Actinopolymorpha cephalotaxi]